MDGNVFLEGENDQTEHRGRRRISSILKASRSPLKTLASGNELHQDTTIDKRRKSSRRVSFAETIRVFTPDLQSAGSVEHEDNGDAKKSDQENEEPTSNTCDISGMETLLHAPIQITGHQNEWGCGFGTGERTLLFCENEMDLTASNTVFIDNSAKTDVTSFLAGLEPPGGDTGRPSSTLFNFPSSRPTTDASVESKFGDFLESLKVGKPTPKPRDVSSDKENIFPDLLPSGCGAMFPLAPLREDTVGDLGQNRDWTFSKAQNRPTNPSSKPQINFSEFLTGLKTGKAATKCPEVDDKESVFPGLPGDKKSQSSRCGEAFSFAPAAREETGNVTRIFKEQDGMDLTRCHTTAITSFIPASAGHFTEKPPRHPLMDRTMITQDDMDMTCSHTVRIESVQSQGQSRVQTLQFNGGRSAPSNETVIFNDSDAMEMTKIHADPDRSLALPPERPFTCVPPADTGLTLPAQAPLDKTVLFSSDHDMEFTKSHTISIDFKNAQQPAATNALRNSKPKRGGLQLSATSTTHFFPMGSDDPDLSQKPADETDVGAKENRVGISNTFSLQNRTRHLQDDMELTEIGPTERTSVHAEDDDAATFQRTMFFLPDQADMDITRSHTVAIDGKNLRPAVQEKANVTGKEDHAFESASMSKTPTASGVAARDRDPVKRNAALAGTRDYGSSLVRGGTGTDLSSPADEGMDFTKCHTVLIEAPLAREASDRETASKSKRLSRDRTILFPSDGDDMDLTQSSTVPIETKLSRATEKAGKTHRKSVGAGVYLASLSDKTVVCGDEMDLTKSHTMLIDMKEPAGQDPPPEATRATAVQEDLDLTRSDRVFPGNRTGEPIQTCKRKSMIVPLFTCPGDAIVTETRTNASALTSKPEIRNEDKGLALSHALQDKTVVFSSDADPMDITRSHTVTIENKTVGAAMPTYKPNDALNDLTGRFPGVRPNVSRAADDTETAKSRVAAEHPHLTSTEKYAERTLCEQDDMDLTGSNMVFIDDVVGGSSKHGFFPVGKSRRQSEPGMETSDQTVYIVADMDITTTRAATDMDITTTRAAADMDITTTRAAADMDITTTRAAADMDITTTRAAADMDITTTRADMDITTTRAAADMDITTTRAAADMDITTTRAASVIGAAASQDKSVFLFDADGMDITRSHTVVIEKPADQVGAGRADDVVEIKPSTSNKSAFQEDDAGHRTSNTKVFFGDNTVFLPGPNTHPSDPSGRIEHTGDIASSSDVASAIVADSTGKICDYKDFNASSRVQRTREQPGRRAHLQDQSLSPCTLTKEGRSEDEPLVENLNVREKTASPSNTGSENLSHNDTTPREPTTASSNDQREDRTDGVPRVGCESECTGTLLTDDVPIAATEKNRPTSKRVSFFLPDAYKPEVVSGTSVPVATMERRDLAADITRVDEEPQKAREESPSCSDPEHTRADQPASCPAAQNVIPRNLRSSPGSKSDNLLPASRRSAPCTVPGRAAAAPKGDATRRSIDDLHLKIKSLMQNSNVAKGPASPAGPAASSDQGLGSKSPEKEPVVESEPCPADGAISPKAGGFQMERYLRNRLSVKVFLPKLPNRRVPSAVSIPPTPSAPETRTPSDRTSLTRLRALTDAEDPQCIDAEILPTCPDGPEPDLCFEVPEGAWEALCETEKLHEDPDPCLSKPGQKRAREAENQTVHREKRAKPSEDSKGTKDFTGFKSLSDGSSSESSLFQTTKGTDPDSCSSCSMDSRVELSQACSQMDSQTQWETECEKSLWQKLQDGTITVKEFFALLRIRILIQKPRYSELPANRGANEDQNPMDALLDHHIFQPKLQVYEEECHALHQVIEELRTNTEKQDKPLAALNSVLWEAMSMCSEEEVMCFGRKLKSMRALYAKKSKLISHKGKGSMYSKLLLDAEDNRKRLQSTISDIDKLLDEVTDTISDLEAETARLKAECQSGRFTHKDPRVAAIQTEYENLKVQEVTGSRKISELEDRKHQLLTQIGDLQEKARGQPDVPEEYTYAEWDLETWTDEQAIFNFLYSSVELAVLFGDPVDGVTFNDAPCRRISSIQFSTMLDDDAAPPSTLLVHRLISQFVLRQGGLPEDCKTQHDLPRLLFDVSLVVNRCKLLGEELEFLMKWGGRYNVLKTEIHNTEVKLLFSSLAALSKFELVVKVTESYPMLPFSFTFHNLIGHVNRAALAAVLSKVPVGSFYLKRCVMEIHKDLLG